MASDHNSNYYDVIDMIRAFSGRDNTIGIPRPLIKFMDSLEGGAFLSQLIYWSDKGGREDGWFYKTYPEWQEDIGLSEYEVRKWSKVMVADGYLETKVMRANGNPTVHYRLDMRKFSESFLEFLRNETGKSKEPKPKNEVSITEITAETTTKNKDKKASHIEKPNGGFSRVSPEHPQAQQPTKRTTRQVPLSSQSALFESPPSVSVEPLPAQPQVTQQQRKPDAMYDAICLAWKTEGGMAGKIQQQLLGKMPKKHPHHASNFAEPATPDEVASFGKWYKNRYPGCDMPMSPEKIQHHFSAFRRETGEAAKKNAPKIREQNGRRLKYDSTLQSWLDIGPAQVPPQSSNRSQNEAYAQ